MSTPVRIFYEFIWTKLTIPGKQNLNRLRKCSGKISVLLLILYYQNQRARCKGITWNALVTGEAGESTAGAVSGTGYKGRGIDTCSFHRGYGALNSPQFTWWWAQWGDLWSLLCWGGCTLRGLGKRKLISQRYIIRYVVVDTRKKNPDSLS